MNAGLSALVVHDLKNRLAAHERRLAELQSAHPALADALGPLRDDVAALRTRLVGFLVLYRDDTGRLRADEQEESPARVLAQAARVARALGAPRGLHVDVEAASAPATWYLDAFLVALALEAAVDNAARHAASRIRLSASTRRIGGAEWLVLAVDDDGPGPHAPSPPLPGTGLGTELCRVVARRHACDGRVGEASLGVADGPGGLGGARFELRLP